MCLLLSRKHFIERHFSDNSSLKNIDIIKMYQNHKYTIHIPLVPGSTAKNKFDSLTIQTVNQSPNGDKLPNKQRQAIIRNDKNCSRGASHKDKGHLGEFIFFLAAKMKYDLLCGLDINNSGFLHTDEIRKFQDDGIIEFGPQIYRNIQPSKYEDFTENFLFQSIQLLHLIAYLGNGGRDNNDINLMFCLNVLPENIFFTINKEVVDDDYLFCYLKDIFPAKCLYSQDALQDFISFLEKNKKPKAKVKPIFSEALATPIKDSSIDEFREKLRDQAQKALKEKLAGEGIDDYRPLSLEIGTIPEKETGFLHDYTEKPRPEDHNREWNTFNFKELKNPKGKYILSSETGSGKTTFLRHLQLEILDKGKTDSIPLFLTADTMSKLDYENDNEQNFINSLAVLFNGYLPDGNEYLFLKDHFEKIIFLIDGLDQIRDKDVIYKEFLDKIFKATNNKIIVSSRPFAVVPHEANSNVHFLRLTGFNVEEQKTYFGSKNFERAAEMCQNCRQMLSIPMLAYMVRLLIKDEEDKGIKNRTELYKKFIHYIFEKHTEFKPGKRTRMRKALGVISYWAIAEEEYLFQIIPMTEADDFLSDHNINIDMDELLTAGLVHTIMNRSPEPEECLYFTHQSFQEYLAAEYISRNGNEDFYEKVLKEKWNPKWKEVIKFLTGLKGQEAIDKILAEKDNIIHSKLFLAAELVPECDVDKQVKRKIHKDLMMRFETLDPQINSFMEEEFLKYSAYADLQYTTNRILFF